MGAPADCVCVYVRVFVCSYSFCSLVALKESGAHTRAHTPSRFMHLPAWHGQSLHTREVFAHPLIDSLTHSLTQTHPALIVCGEQLTEWKT